MKATSVAASAFGAAVCAAVAGLLAGCGTSSAPSAQSTVTVTVTASPTSAPASSQPAATPTPAPTPTPTGPPGCATAGLKAALGAGGGAAGSVYYPIVFTNTSASACTLYGYPGVSFIAASGAQVGAAAREDPVYPRQLVTLAAGGSAHAELQITDAQNYPSSTCSPVAVHRLKVFPPGQTSALYVAVTTTGCAKSSVQILEVQTVQPGDGAQ
jgi:hypothetical protein